MRAIGSRHGVVRSRLCPGTENGERSSCGSGSGGGCRRRGEANQASPSLGGMSSGGNGGVTQNGVLVRVLEVARREKAREEENILVCKWAGPH